MTHNPIHRMNKMLREIKSILGDADVFYTPSVSSRHGRRALAKSMCGFGGVTNYWPRSALVSWAKERRRHGPEYLDGGCWECSKPYGIVGTTPERAVRNALRFAR